MPRLGVDSKFKIASKDPAERTYEAALEYINTLQRARHLAAE